MSMGSGRRVGRAGAPGFPGEGVIPASFCPEAPLFLLFLHFQASSLVAPRSFPSALPPQLPSCEDPHPDVTHIISGVRVTVHFMCQPARAPAAWVAGQPSLGGSVQCFFSFFNIIVFAYFGCAGSLLLLGLSPSCWVVRGPLLLWSRGSRVSGLQQMQLPGSGARLHPWGARA